MFKIWLTNFGWYANEDREVKSLDCAMMICRQNGFEARIDRTAFNNRVFGDRLATGFKRCDPTPVMLYSPLNGFTDIGVNVVPEAV